MGVATDSTVSSAAVDGALEIVKVIKKMIITRSLNFGRIFILKSSKLQDSDFSNSIQGVKKNISIDSISCCFKENNLTVNDDSNRNKDILCVIKDPTEVFLIEKSGYNGHYHVLNGLISPLDGVTHANLNIENLLCINILLT